jgi:hypothetical protein
MLLVSERVWLCSNRCSFALRNHITGYKVLQRIYKFGGQPYFNDYLTNHHKSWFQKTFGERNGKSMMSATAGRCVMVL